MVIVVLIVLVAAGGFLLVKGKKQTSQLPTQNTSISPSIDQTRPEAMANQPAEPTLSSSDSVNAIDKDLQGTNTSEDPNVKGIQDDAAGL